LKNRTKYSGKVLSDIALVYEKLKDWISIIEADELVPYVLSHKTKNPPGARLWILCQQRGQYFNGTWFDVKKLPNTKKIKIKQIRLCEEAVKVFEAHPEMKTNES